MDLEFTIAPGFDSFLLDLDAPQVKGGNPVPSYFFEFVAAEEPEISSEDESYSQLQGYDSSYSSSASTSASPRITTPDLTPEMGPTLRSPALAVAAFCCPNIIRGIIESISYPDFHALIGVSRAIRDSFLAGAGPIKDSVFSAFVPGYGAATALRDEMYYKDVPVNFIDLHQLVISQNVPLDKYAAVALECVASSHSTPELVYSAARLQVLARAHSIFVLLLQAIVHSATETPHEFHEIAEPLQPQNIGLRELTFPAPLIYETQIVENTEKESPKAPKVRRAKLKRRTASDPGTEVTPFKHKRSGSLTSLTTVKGSRALPPSPSSTTLDQYAKWRRRASTSSSSLTSRRSSFQINDLAPPLPTHPWVRSRANMSASSSSESIVSRKRSSRASGTPPEPGHDHQQSLRPRPFSLHGLNLAISRARAPILRVFVPCSDINDDFVSKCAIQLMEGGLWHHLSAGDLVCNFGYVPWQESPNQVFWLVFDGQALVHFNPRSPPPIWDVLSLPSPFYYAHLLPPEINPQLFITIPAAKPSPAVKTSSTRARTLSVVVETNPDTDSTSLSGAENSTTFNEFGAGFSLISVPANVPSPHSPRGFASVNRHVWVARYIAPSLMVELGEGWTGEWVIEGQGTKEGKSELEECVQDLGGVKKFECVKERSVPGRVWLRLLSTKTMKPLVDIL